MNTSNLDTELSKLRIDRNRKRPRKGQFTRIALALVALAACGVGYVYYTKLNAPIEVKVAKAVREETAGASRGSAILTAGGYVIPRKNIEVSSQIVGRVKEIHIDRGDQVKAGDVLMELVDDEQQAQVRRAEAQLGMAESQLAELRAGSRPEEKAAARAEVASAEANLDWARVELDRMEDLFAKQIVSKQELDKARTAHDVAAAELKSSQKRAELVEAGPRQEEILTAESRLREAEANLSYAKTQLDYTIIRAPIDGTILEKVAEKGELVTNTNFGGTRGAKSSVVSMANLKDLQVELDLNENDLHKVRLGQKCEVRLDSNADLVITGEVDEIAPQADRQKATVQVKVRLIDPDPSVRAEVNARVTFLEEAPPPAQSGEPAQPRVYVPGTALIMSDTGSFVYIAAGGTAVQRKVETGLSGEKGVEIKSGLAGNEELIIEPLDMMEDGAKITVK